MGFFFHFLSDRCWKIHAVLVPEILDRLLTHITRSPVEILLTNLKKKKKRSRVVSKIKSKGCVHPYA